MSACCFRLSPRAALTGAVPADVDRGAITRVRAIGAADAASLVFAEDEASLRAALASEAGAILAGLRLPATADERVLRVADPRYAFAVCARALAQGDGRDGAPKVHPGATVDATARRSRATPRPRANLPGACDRLAGGTTR